jgi:hypothetical protein
MKGILLPPKLSGLRAWQFMKDVRTWNDVQARIGAVAVTLALRKKRN